MITNAIRNSVSGPLARVSWTMAMVTVGEKETITVASSAAIAAACGQPTSARNGNTGRRAIAAAAETRKMIPLTAVHRAATRAPTRRMSPRRSSVPAVNAIRLTARPFTRSSPSTPSAGRNPSALGPTAMPIRR